MAERRNDVDLGFVSQHYSEGTHMCLIYKDEAERREIISRYLQSGLEGREKVAYFAVKTTKDEFIASLEETGVKLNRDHLEVLDAVETYCPSGKFDPEDMLENLRRFHRTAREEGYDCCRVSGEMHWALEPIPGTDRLMEYEALINDVVKTHPVTAICQYDARKFDGETIIDCLKVHPYMIVHGQVMENPYYLSPEEFLKQR